MRLSLPVPPRWGGAKNKIEELLRRRGLGNIKLLREGRGMEAFLIENWERYLTKGEKERLDELKRESRELARGDPQRRLLGVEIIKIIREAKMRAIEDLEKEE